MVVGKGNNRDFAANDPSQPYKVQLRGVITRYHFEWKVELEARAGLSEARVPVVPPLRGAVTMDVGPRTTDKEGNLHFAVQITGTNGFSAATGIGDSNKIQINLNLIVTPNGKVGIEKGSESTNYPSIGIYSYNLGPDGKPMANVITEYRETKPSALGQPLVEVFPVAPSRCPESPGCKKQ